MPCTVYVYKCMYQCNAVRIIREHNMTARTEQQMNVSCMLFCLHAKLAPDTICLVPICWLLTSKANASIRKQITLPPVIQSKLSVTSTCSLIKYSIFKLLTVNMFSTAKVPSPSRAYFSRPLGLGITVYMELASNSHISIYLRFLSTVLQVGDSNWSQLLDREAMFA